MVEPGGMSLSDLRRELLNRSFTTSNLHWGLRGLAVGTGVGLLGALGHYIAMRRKPPALMYSPEYVLPLGKDLAEDEKEKKKRKGGFSKQSTDASAGASSKDAAFWDGVFASNTPGPGGSTSWLARVPYVIPAALAAGAGASLGYFGTQYLERGIRKQWTKHRLNKAKKEYEAALRRVLKKGPESEEDEDVKQAADDFIKAAEDCLDELEKSAFSRFVEYLVPSGGRYISTAANLYGNILALAAILGGVGGFALGASQAKSRSRRSTLEKAQYKRYREKAEDLDQPLFFVESGNEDAI